MAFQVFHDPQDVQIGSIALTGVVTISTTSTFAEIHASADDDTVESVARFATERTGGTISFVDPVEAASARGVSGTLTWTWEDVKTGGTDKTGTIENTTIVSDTETVSRDAPASATVTFIAESALAIT